MSIYTLILGLMIACGVGFWIALWAASFKVTALETQILELQGQLSQTCDQCDAKTCYEAARADAEAAKSDLERLRKNYRNIFSTNKKLWRLAQR